MKVLFNSSMALVVIGSVYVMWSSLTQMNNTMNQIENAQKIYLASK